MVTTQLQLTNTSYRKETGGEGRVLEEEVGDEKWPVGRWQHGQKFEHFGRIWNYSARYNCLMLQNHFTTQITRFPS